MDEDIQKSLRNLARNYHLGQFSAPELLKYLQITKVYHLSGAINGVFFQPSDLLDAVIHYEVLDVAETGKLREWVQNLNRSEEIALEISHETDFWIYTPRATGLGTLRIKTIDLTSRQPNCCRDSKSIARLHSALLLAKCECQAEVCVRHQLLCRICDENHCFNCNGGFVDDQGNLINQELPLELQPLGYPICFPCFEKLPKENL